MRRPSLSRAHGMIALGFVFLAVANVMAGEPGYALLFVVCAGVFGMSWLVQPGQPSEGDKPETGQ